MPVRRAVQAARYLARAAAHARPRRFEAGTLEDGLFRKGGSCNAHGCTQPASVLHFCGANTGELLCAAHNSGLTDLAKAYCKAKGIRVLATVSTVDPGAPDGLQNAWESWPDDARIRGDVPIPPLPQPDYDAGDRPLKIPQPTGPRGGESASIDAAAAPGDVPSTAATSGAAHARGACRARKQKAKAGRAVDTTNPQPIVTAPLEPDVPNVAVDARYARRARTTVFEYTK